jgi:hypothetical protein
MMNKSPETRIIAVSPGPLGNWSKTRKLFWSGDLLHIERPATHQEFINSHRIDPETIFLALNQFDYYLVHYVGRIDIVEWLKLRDVS